MLGRSFLLLAVFQLLILTKPALCECTSYVHPTLTENSAFIASRDGKVIKEIGQTQVRHAPFSTFKITLALMGFDAGILKDKDKPVWAFQEAYLENFPKWLKPGMVQKYKWYGNHTPGTFMRQSVLWYSYQITERLGKDKFKNDVMKLNYGNMDVSGTPGQEDGLYSSWLGTSLKISPREQVRFLEKLVANELPVSKEAQQKTFEIMNREEDWDGWKLYGKTGGGRYGTGWFVGWIEKENQRIFFAHFIELNDPNSGQSVGTLAKEEAKIILKPYLKK